MSDPFGNHIVGFPELYYKPFYLVKRVEGQEWLYYYVKFLSCCCVTLFSVTVNNYSVVTYVETEPNTALPGVNASCSRTQSGTYGVRTSDLLI